MARTLTEIYSVAKDCRDKYLQLTEFQNSSKMSVLDAFTWTTAACIWTFENIMDVFKVDLARNLQNRINGTPGYYANALLKFQYGDELQMNEEGTQFSYASVNENKRIITRVSYSENSVSGFLDKELQLKVATGEPGHYQQLTEEQLMAAKAYLQQIVFAGTHYNIVSRKGDVLIPRVTVYYDGSVSPNQMYEAIEESLNEFVESMPFDGVVYVQKIIDAFQKVEHVVDVHINTKDSERQGIFIAQYDDDNNIIIQENGSAELEIDRCFIPNSGYMKESTEQGVEAKLPAWRNSIILAVEGQ